MRLEYKFGKWEYEIIKNEGSGLQGYGYRLGVYQNDKKVYEGGSYVSEAAAMSKAIDVILEGEFGIDMSSDE